MENLLGIVLKILAENGETRTLTLLQMVRGNIRVMQKKLCILEPLVFDHKTNIIRTVFKLPIISSKKAKFIIDWGDGSIYKHTGDILNQNKPTHEYGKSGSYRIKLYNLTDKWVSLTSVLDPVWADSITNFISIGRIGIVSLENIFGNTRFRGIIGPNWDTSRIQYVHNMLPKISEYSHPFGLNWDTENFDLSLFQIVCRDNAISALKNMIRLGLDLSKPNKRGDTPLMTAIMMNCLEIGELLASMGIGIGGKRTELEEILNIKLSNWSKDTERDERFIKLLIQLGADVNNKGTYGYTPLMKAVLNNLGENVINMLLESGAKPDLQNNLGWTALHYACEYYTEDTEYVGLLIKAGANIEIRDYEGNTPLWIACYHLLTKIKYVKKAKEIIKILIDAGADTSVHNKNSDGIFTKYGFPEYIQKCIDDKKK